MTRVSTLARLCSDIFIALRRCLLQPLSADVTFDSISSTLSSSSSLSAAFADTSQPSLSLPAPFQPTADFGRKKMILTLHGYIKTAQQRTIIHHSTVIGTMAVDGWAVTFGTARRGLGGLRSHPVPSSLQEM